MRVDIKTKSGQLPWSQKKQTSKVIDLQDYFNDYWASEAQELTVTGQS
jgi:hypothetical protein